MRRKRVWLYLLILAVLLVPAGVVFADGPNCTYNPANGGITCETGGGNDDDGGEGGSGSDDGEIPACTPGQHLEYQVLSYDPATNICTVSPVWVDNCTGQIIETAGDLVDDAPCQMPETATPPSHPCETFSISGGAVTCEATRWDLQATVQFPETFLDVRPFPATLVRWPTALRNGGQPAASGAGSVDYVANGGGSPGNPAVGDWANLTLSLTLSPAGPLQVRLPYAGGLSLPDQGRTGAPTLIQWELPSHPAAGGGPLARSISGLEELPGDLPLFVGSGRSPYRLFWNLSYFQYEAIEDCVSGPNGNGQYNCGGGTGHKVVVGYEWGRHSSGGEISPGEVANLPARLAADLNGDGSPDAYWDYNLTLRRMNNANRVNDPVYARSWNWGGTIYWGVREGQGQIGWPGK